MAFVAFGKKKVSSVQQQPEGSKTPMANCAKDGSSCQQQNIPTPGSKGNEIEGFKILEDLDMDAGGLLTTRSLDLAAMGQFPHGLDCESPTRRKKPKQGLLESDAAEQLPQFWEHNVALRRNFDDVSAQLGCNR
jgi:hypothetical protein